MSNDSRVIQKKFKPLPIAKNKFDAVASKVIREQGTTVKENKKINITTIANNGRG